MNIFTSIAIVVSVLGVAIIIIVVVLFFRYRLTKRVPDAELVRPPPLRKLIVHHGRVVPAYKLPTPSIKSGWSSLKHRSWLISRPSPIGWEDFSRPSSFISHQSSGDMSNRIWHKQGINTIVESRGPSMEQVSNDFSPLINKPHFNLAKLKTNTKFSWNDHFSAPSTVRSSTNYAARTSVSDNSFQSSPTFPRPPYLSPLQSTYHVSPVETPSSPLSRTQRTDG